MAIAAMRRTAASICVQDGGEARRAEAGWSSLGRGQLAPPARSLGRVVSPPSAGSRAKLHAAAVDSGAFLNLPE